MTPLYWWCELARDDLSRAGCHWPEGGAMSLAEEAMRLRDELAREEDGYRVAHEAAGELIAACAKFSNFNSPHEGWAVIREELDELWEHVKANTGSSEGARQEAIQIAAMALRYALDCGPEVKPDAE